MGHLDRAERSEAALKRCGLPTLLCVAMWLSRPAPRCWQDALPRDQITGYKVAVTLFVNFPSSRLLLVDGYLQVTDEEAISTARRLAAEEGIFAGFSSGANVAAALQLLRAEDRDQTVVTLACDSGLKYLSTDLWLQS
jgi:threonine synthase